MTKLDNIEAREAIIDSLRFGAPIATTIKDGVLRVTSSYHTVDTEVVDGVHISSDDVDTITGFDPSQRFFFLRPAHDDRTVVLKHDTGNIICGAAADITLENESDLVLCLFDMALGKCLVQPFDATSSNTSNNNTLDQAYDQGGPGAGRQINTTDGAVYMVTTEADVAPNLLMERAAADATRAIQEVWLTGEAHPRVRILANGTIRLGSGSATPSMEIAWEDTNQIQISAASGDSGGLATNNLYELTTNAKTSANDGMLVDAAFVLQQDSVAISGNNLRISSPFTIVSNSGTINTIDSTETSLDAGSMIVLSAASGQTVVLANAGNDIEVIGGSDITLDDVDEWAIGFFVGGIWRFWSPTSATSHAHANDHARGHVMLDGGTDHTDTAADAVTRGSLIYGNSTPAWDELVVGAASTVLTSDGTDVSWQPASSGDDAIQYAYYAMVM